MQETQDTSYRESTIVSPRRAATESKEASWAPVEVVGDRITLSEVESAAKLSEAEARKQEWLNSQRGKGKVWATNPQLAYRPQTIMLTGNANSSAFVHVALNAAAGWDRNRR